MNAQDLRKLLEQADDKLNIFTNRETLNKYEFNEREFLNLIRNKLHLESFQVTKLIKGLSSDRKLDILLKE